MEALVTEKFEKIGKRKRSLGDIGPLYLRPHLGLKLEGTGGARSALKSYDKEVLLLRITKTG